MNEADKQHHIAVVLGTARTGRESARVALALVVAAQLRGHRVTLVDVADHQLSRTIAPGEDVPETAQWKQIAADADGFIWVIPEYNHSYPGEFKLLIDAAFDEYARKPVALATVSVGGFGGSRLTEVARVLASVVGAVPIPKALNVSRVVDSFAEDGTITDVAYEARIATVMDDLGWYLDRLRD
jgi:Predicted flavoprotein